MLFLAVVVFVIVW